MTETRTPNDIYLDALVAPYVDAMKNIQDTQTFYNWVTQIISEDDEDFYRIEDEINSDLETQKNNFIDVLKEKLVDSIAQQQGIGGGGDIDFTPWELSRFRNEETTRLFGPTSTEPLPVTVDLNGQLTKLPMSEELAVGILIASQRQIPLYMYGVPLDLGYLSHKFLTGNFYPDHPLYHVQIHGGMYYFVTPDFIQGAITASNWLEVNPKQVITELYSINPDGSETLLNFN